MHTKPMDESEGDLGPMKSTDEPCPNGCGAMLRVQVWDSKCGGYTDHKYSCQQCGYVHWVEGPDA